MRKFNFTWKETHFASVMANSQEEAEKAFHEDSAENFGGQDTFIDSSVGEPEIEEKKVTDRCSNCSAEFKTKYLIRVIHKHADPKARSFYESRTKRSIVGWIKFICNNYNFEEIEIKNLLTECQEHEEYWKNKRVKKSTKKKES